METKSTYIFRFFLLINLLICLFAQVALSQIVVNTKDVSCYGGSDGWIRVTVPNATPPVKYQWDDGLTGQNRTSLKAGNYIVSITDATLCERIKIIGIGEPEERLKVIIETVQCATVVACGEYQPIIVRARATGGTPPYEINGRPGATYVEKINRSRRMNFSVEDDNHCKAKNSRIVLVSKRSCPKDPNDILGPPGFDSAQWISKQDTLDYTIRFENDPILATAPAQRVFVTHDFGPNVNPFSFRLSTMAIGDLIIDVPPNRSVYQERIDLTTTQNLFVDVVAGLDVENNRAFWTFTSIDPLTGLQPIDPAVGFLPVNDTLTGSGEGFVSFTVKPADHTTTGDTVLADASIVFNVEEAIETNVWSNIIDAIPPTTSVVPLVDTSASTNITLNWIAMDDPIGSGIREVEIYMSVDSSEFELFQIMAGDSATSINFEAEYGSHYAFYTQGVDNVGNKEIKSATEASTFVLPERQLEVDLLADNAVCPNDTFTLFWTSVLVDSIDVYLFEEGVGNDSLLVRLDANLFSYEFIAPPSLSDQDIRFRIVDVQDPMFSDTSQIIEVKSAPTIDAGDPLTICAGEVVNLVPDGANEYLWSPQIGFNNPMAAIQSFLADSTQTYYMDGIDVFGCRSTDSVTITVLPSFTKYIYTPICEGDSVFIDGNWETQEDDYVIPNNAVNGCDSSTIYIVSYIATEWSGGTTVYVDSSATGENNGADWSNAFTDLQKALCLAYSIDSVNHVWVAGGTYFPSSNNLRLMSFVIQDSIQIFGGFAGGETMITQRDANLNPTRLSGDVGIKLAATDNAFHVIRIDPASSNSLIDGFTIQDGYADGVDSSDQKGAGVYSEGDATLSQITFENHFSTGEGSLILNLGANAKLTLQNCTFKYNQASPMNDILNSANAKIIMNGNNVVEE